MSWSRSMLSWVDLNLGWVEFMWTKVEPSRSGFKLSWVVATHIQLSHGVSTFIRIGPTHVCPSWAMPKSILVQSRTNYVQVELTWSVLVKSSQPWHRLNWVELEVRPSWGEIMFRRVRVGPCQLKFGLLQLW